jgi:hypothetical protein
MVRWRRVRSARTLPCLPGSIPSAAIGFWKIFRSIKMKRTLFVLFTLVAFALAGPALAAPAEKSTILHCGCQWDGFDASMSYEEISINSKSRGHDAHVVGSIDACFTGQELVDDVLVDTFADFVRNGDDCQLDGPPLGDPIESCESFEDPDPVAGDSCGSAVIE